MAKKQNTTEKQQYLAYFKKKGKSSMTYGQWKKARGSKGSSQHKSGMSNLSRSDYLAVSKMKDKKK